MDSRLLASEQVEDAAARWFARQQSGSWTDADQAQFDAWLEAATAHRIQYIRVKTFWDRAARMTALGAGVARGMIPGRGEWGDVRFPGAASDGEPAGETRQRVQAELIHPLPRLSSLRSGERPADQRSERELGEEPGREEERRASRPGRTRPWLAVAASAVLAICGGVYLYESGLFAGDRYSTPVGGLDTVALSDGSRVVLNTDSAVRVELLETERRIALTRGEAFFDVARDPARPFVVEAGEKRVVAVGTAFSVRREGDDILVVVTEGKVRVETSAKSGQGEGASVGTGSIARTSKTEVLVRPNAASEAEKLLSWRRGYVSFDHMALADAIAEFNRYTRRKIYIEDPAIAAILVGGNFRSNNADAFLDLLENGFPIVVEREDDRIVLRGR